MSVKNREPEVKDITPVIDKNIEDTVFEIFDAVLRLNPLEKLFEDLSKRLIEDLHTNSFMEFDLALKEEQKEQLRRALLTKGHETARLYLANLKNDERSKEIYGKVREKTTAIVDALLSDIGREINRGAVINAYVVMANAKAEDYDEILLRKTKGAGDITIPCNCLLISTNCVAVIKASCQSEKAIPEGSEGDSEDAIPEDGEEELEKAPKKKSRKAAADKREG
jgi:hypothetical protein